MSRGLKLNNPGNIRHSISRWRGASEEQTDREFVRFETLEYGYRALWILMSNYYHLRNRRTIHDILQRYAPPGENDTNTYIRFLLPALKRGWTEEDSDGEKLAKTILPPPQNDYRLWARILTRITMMEQGIKEKEVNSKAIQAGYHAAFRLR